MNCLKGIFGLVLAVLMLFSTANVFAATALYDDFSGTYIDGEKWYQREYVREIVDGEFVSKLGNRSPGMNAEIWPGLFLNHLPFSNPSTITAIECDVTVNDIKPDSVADSISGATLIGYFYNTNASGGATGDIVAFFTIGKINGSENIEAFWKVIEIMSDDLSTTRIIDNGIIDDFDSVATQPPYRTKISYDGTNQITFEVASHEYTYVGPSRERAAVTQFKSLSTGIGAVNGSDNGYISASFDNVYINGEGSVYDDFSSPVIDQSKWQYREFVREQTGGYLRSNIIGSDSTQTLNTHLTDKSTPYFEAKALIESDTALDPGAIGIARLQGYYYNDSRGPGSGLDHNVYEGDVFVQIRLVCDSERNLNAVAYVDRSNDANESSYTNLFAHGFSTVIAFDTYYTLSIRFDGQKLIFGCDGETAEYNIVSPIYPAYGEHRLLRSRLYLDSGEYGYIKTRFDDIFIEKSTSLSPAIPLLLLDE